MKAIAGLVSVAAAACLAATAGAQEIFRWTDGNGVVHYSDAEPKGVGAVERMPVTLAPTIASSRLPDPINDVPVDAAADVPASVPASVPTSVPASVRASGPAAASSATPPGAWPSTTTLSPRSAPPPAAAATMKRLPERSLSKPVQSSPPAPTELSMLELERLCDYAKQKVLAPVRDAAIAQCKADTRNDPAFCDRFNVYFSDAETMVSGALQSNVLDGLPECVTADQERRRRGL
jgi:hypothetical protein